MERVCPECGMTYDEFRTGLTFADVKADMFVSSDNPEDWIYKRKHSVLGRWKMIKEMMWRHHLDECKERGNDIGNVVIEGDIEY